MPFHPRFFSFTWIISVNLIGLLVFSGCGDDEDSSTGPSDGRINVGNLPEGAGKFVGFSDQATKRTVCGECHVGIQAAWEASHHAEAWEGLQEGGHAQAFCENCHAVSENGNPEEGDVAWTATRDERFVGVQCENCHGPGLDHIENPDASQPLARIAAGLNLDFGCGECHQGTHHPFVSQWEISAHGQVPAQSVALAVSPSCLNCHEGKAALQNTFGERTDFALVDENAPQPILCITCHDPHGSPYEAQLRAPIDVASTEHLCVECHNRRGTPNLQGSNDHGPHAFQGNLVLGENVGWIPDNFRFDAQSLASSHGSMANPGLCTTCHVSKFEVTDEETGDFVFNATGHSFEATPCLDAQGVPTAGPCETNERSFQSCAASSCHASGDIARNLTQNTTGRINRLLDQLWDDTNGNAVLETTDGGLLPRVLAQEGAEAIDPFDAVFSTAEGALWNAQIAWTRDRPHWGSGQIEGLEDSFSSHKGSGDGVHNPFLIEALLTASIEAVENRYSLAAGKVVSLRNQLQLPPGISVH